MYTRNSANAAERLVSSVALPRRKSSKYILDGDSDDSAYNSDGLPRPDHPRTLAKERGEVIPPRLRRPRLATTAAADQDVSSETDSDADLVSEAAANNATFLSMTKVLQSASAALGSSGFLLLRRLQSSL